MDGISVVSVPVSDPQRSKRFYMQLGFTVLNEMPMANGRSWIQLGIPGSPTTLALVTWFSAMPPGSMQGLVLSTSDLQVEVEKLKRHGVHHSKVEETPHGKFLSIKDPDGNSLSIREQPRG
jgi:catechol 2,3-dioxygenase-like lactoylglutathione lyase family enzyme